MSDTFDQTLNTVGNGETLDIDYERKLMSYAITNVSNDHDFEVIYYSDSQTYLPCGTRDYDGYFEDVVKETISYDYELVTKDDVDVTEAVLSLETKLSKYVTDELGCNDSRFLRLLRRNLDDNVLIGLDYEPLDTVDDKYDCINSNVFTSGTCYPISGILSAYVCSTCTTPEIPILDIIKKGMTDGAFINDDILQVVYIGNRDDIQASSTTTTTIINENDAGATGQTAASAESQEISNNQQRGSSMAAISGVIFIVIVLAIAGVLMFVIKRWTNNKSQQQKDDAGVKDIEKPSPNVIERQETGIETINSSEVTDDVSEDLDNWVLSSSSSSSSLESETTEEDNVTRFRTTGANNDNNNDYDRNERKKTVRRSMEREETGFEMSIVMNDSGLTDIVVEDV